MRRIDDGKPFAPVRRERGAAAARARRGIVAAPRLVGRTMTPLATRIVHGTDGVAIRVYHEATASALPVLWSHATGFHGRVFDAAIEALAAIAAGRCASTTFDYRGHGDTPAPAGWDVDWDGYGDDATCVARDVAERAGAPVVGVGHSMGGAGLVMAALRDPSRFAALVVCEPIVFPPDVRAAPRGDNPLSAGARRRRRDFPSAEEAIANYSRKPPLDVLDPRVLADYVAHGFAAASPPTSAPRSATPTADGPVPVVLKCDPELEARTYEMGARHATWEALERLAVPTWVVSGAVAPMGPSAFARRIAERIPGATYVEWPDLGHFAPLQDPARIARLVADVALGHAAPGGTPPHGAAPRT